MLGLILATAFALDAVFTDHMVLQRNRPIRFSGLAAVDATVEVELDGVKGSAKADAMGCWTVELPARKEGGPYAVTVVRREGGEAKETLRLEDVLVGEVWLGSGQSNMEFWVLGENLESPQFYSLTNGEEVAATKDPLLRVLYVPHAVAPEGPRRAAKLGWKRAETREANGRMSAVAFLFGKELRRRLGPNVPVGIASAAWGGTEIETWIPETQFRAQGNEFDLARLAAARLTGDTETRKEALRKAIYAKRSVDLRAWSDLLRATGEKPSAPLADFDGPGVTVKRIAVDIPAGWDGHAAELHLEGVSDFDRTRFGGVEVGATGIDTPSYWSVPRNYRIASLKQGRQELEIEIEHHCGRAQLGDRLTLKDLETGETRDLGKLPRSSEVKLIGNPMRIGYRPPDPYNGVHGDPAEDPQMPTSLFNGMIAPLTAMNIGGVIWYQGCGNAHDPRRYRALQSDLVDGWRTAFRNSEMPFLITQVSTYSMQTPTQRQPDDFWKAETVPFKVRGFAPIRQAQDAMDAYPYVGVACTIDIGDHSDIHPPNKQEVARRLGHEAMRVAFGNKTARPAPRAKLATQTKEGVVVSFNETGRGLVMDGGEKTFHPHHFALAGRDGVFSWAEGRLRDDGTVLVTSETVREPWYVQYCMSGCPVEVGFRRADDALPVMPFELEVRKPGVIRPGETWRDTTGKPIHAHGGSILVSEGKFWWYGENKEGVDGRSKTWHRGVRAYTSENLVDWTDEGVIIEYDHEACMDRPHILYNAKTKKYVAWLKVMHGDKQTRTILTADRMKGPWKVEKDNFLPAGLSSGDFDLAEAEDGRAYSYFERPHDALVSAELTDDYLDLKPETVRFDFPNRKPPYTREAPAHFLKDGKHYLFTSGTSGYYPNPSEVAEADGWLAQWTKLGDAHPDDPSRTSFHSQISSVFKVPGKDLYIALADRWLPNQMDITYPMVENAFCRWFGHGGSDDALYDRFQAIRSGRKDATCDARYVWLPVVFKDGVPRVEWRDEWSPDASLGPSLQAYEVTARKGLGNFYAKCVPGATVRVAFFGGSITEADGWKTFTMENLRRRFPGTKFELIDAALGGTGSDYGVYRLAKDVLPYKPDLMFVEFLTNDGDANRLRAIEGYVRNYYTAFPESDIVFAYTLNKQTAPIFQRGLLPKGAEAFERVAERYGIPSITMGLRAAEMANRGELVWNKGDTQVKALAGKETEKDRPEDETGPIVFLSDGAHPYRETGHRLYAEAVARGLDAIAAAKLPPVDRHTLPEPLESAMGTVRFYSPEAAQESGLVLKGAGWRNDTTIQTSWWKDRPSFYKFYKSSWRSGLGEGVISFRFKGASVLFAPLYGPGTGAAEITVDGKSRRVDFFDLYSAFWRMGPYLLCDKLDPNVVHEVTIRNLPDACDREKVMREAGRGADYEKHKADFQVPQELMFCGLFVEGELVK